MPLTVRTMTINNDNAALTEADAKGIKTLMGESDEAQPDVILLATQETALRGTLIALRRQYSVADYNIQYHQMDTRTKPTEVFTDSGIGIFVITKKARVIESRKDSIVGPKCESFEDIQEIRRGRGFTSAYNKGGLLARLKFTEKDTNDVTRINFASVHLDSKYDHLRCKDLNNVMKGIYRRAISENLPLHKQWEILQKRIGHVMIAGDFNTRNQTTVDTKGHCQPRDPFSLTAPSHNFIQNLVGRMRAYRGKSTSSYKEQEAFKTSNGQAFFNSPDPKRPGQTRGGILDWVMTRILGPISSQEKFNVEEGADLDVKQGEKRDHTGACTCKLTLDPTTTPELKDEKQHQMVHQYVKEALPAAMVHSFDEGWNKKKNPDDQKKFLIEQFNIHLAQHGSLDKSAKHNEKELEKLYHAKNKAIKNILQQIERATRVKKSMLIFFSKYEYPPISAKLNNFVKASIHTATSVSEVKAFTNKITEVIESEVKKKSLLEGHPSPLAQSVNPKYQPTSDSLHVKIVDAISKELASASLAEDAACLCDEKAFR